MRKRISLLVGGLVVLIGLLAYSQRAVVRGWTFNDSGAVDRGHPCTDHGNPDCIHSCWNFDAPVDTYPDDCSGVPYSMTLSGAPVRVDDYTHPLGLGNAEGMGWSFDGAADYLSRADDGSFDMDLTHNPGGDFSVQCVVTPDDVADVGFILSKGTGAPNTGWFLYQSSAKVTFGLSDDGSAAGGHISSLSANNVLAAHRPAFITVTYNYTADGTSEARIYVDNLAAASSNAFDGPVYDSNRSFIIGANDGGGQLIDALFHDCKIYKGEVLTQSQHGQMLTQWQGRTSSQYHTLNMTAASPPAIPLNTVASGVEPFLIDIPVDTSVIGEIVAGSGGHYSPSDLTSKWWRGSCETCDGANHCTGWSMQENAGGGAATVVIDCDASQSAHGGTSVKFTADGGAVPKNANARGACQVNWINQDVALITWGITQAGAASCYIQLVEYTDGACTVWNSTNNLTGAADPGASWTDWRGDMAAAGWNGATNSWRPQLRCNATGTGYEVAFDAFMALQAPTTFHTDASCTTDADADAVCTTNVSIDNSSPLSMGTWTVRGIWRQSQDGAETTNKILFENDATAGNNNRVRVSHDTDLLRCSVWDSAGVERAATVAAAINADTDYEFEVYHTDTGRVGCCWQVPLAGAWTCGVEAVNAIMDGVSLDYNLGVDDNTWLRAVKFWGRMLR